MTRLLHSQLAAYARQRGEGYLAAVNAAATLLPTHVEIPTAKLLKINALWPVISSLKPMPPVLSDPVTKPVAVPVVWPLNMFGVAARVMKLSRTPEDRGVGDTLARVIGPIGGDAYKKWFLEVFGKSCGCQERQDKLNEMFPYEKIP